MAEDIKGFETKVTVTYRKHDSTPYVVSYYSPTEPTIQTSDFSKHFYALLWAYGLVHGMQLCGYTRYIQDEVKPEDR